LRRKQPPYREDHTQADTLTFPVGNNVSASLRNYVSGKHLYLGKYVSVDNQWARDVSGHWNGGEKGKTLSDQADR
jgi:hypothetical protein